MTGLLIGLIIGAGVTYFVIRIGTKKHEATTDDAGWYTVIGVWQETKERYTLHVQANSARDAEDLAQYEAMQNASTLWVVGVFEGKIDNADKYATFVDPDVKPTDWTNTEHGKI